jgi:hypothetical protein
MIFCATGRVSGPSVNSRLNVWHTPLGASDILSFISGSNAGSDKNGRMVMLAPAVRKCFCYSTSKGFPVAQYNNGSHAARDVADFPPSGSREAHWVLSRTPEARRFLLIAVSETQAAASYGLPMNGRELWQGF